MPNTREKLIELLEDRRLEASEVCGSMNKGFGAWYADHLIANGVTVQQWIPVTERLPEDDFPKDTKRLMIRCLVFTDKGMVKPCVRQRWKHFDGQLVPWQWNKDLYAKPTHWMPLPEPPKGEQPCGGSV